MKPAPSSHWTDKDRSSNKKGCPVSSLKRSCFFFFFFFLNTVLDTCKDIELLRGCSFTHLSAVSECCLSAHPLLSSLQGKVSQFGPSCPLLQLSDRKCVCEYPPGGSAGMTMPLHQISVIPRDVTSSRVCGNGKAKDKDKQV